MVINHNMSAMYANRQLGVTGLGLSKDMEKLSSGERINRAGDDASGLAVSEKMRSQIRGLNQASQNASNGISFIQTTEGYLQETTDIMQRIRELGKIPGVALNPGTSSEAVRYLLDTAGLVLVMTVNPGFGGQKLIPAALDKIREVRAMLDAARSDALLEVDGGVTADNARLFTDPGATLLVSGTGVFKAKDRREAIERMRG